MTSDQYDLLDPTFAWLWDPTAEGWTPFRLKTTPGCVPHFRIPVADVRPRQSRLIGDPPALESRKDCERTLRCMGGVVGNRPVLIDGEWREIPHHCAYIEDPRSAVLQAKMDALEQYTIERERARVAEEASRERREQHEADVSRAFKLLRAEGHSVLGPYRTRR